MKKTANSELDRLSIIDFKEANKNPFVLVLDNVRSFHNVGSVFRTADAFLLEGIYLCGITARPPHRDIRKTALGATETVAWRHFETTTAAIQDLKAQNYVIIAIEQAHESIMLQDIHFEKLLADFFKNNDIELPKEKIKYALVLGHEVKGVSKEAMQMIDACIEIPQYGTKHSLNISVSAGLVIWDLLQKWQGFVEK
ncbi:MAG: RNA methyltransferase [Chitinophagales bacterium]